MLIVKVGASCQDVLNSEGMKLSSTGFACQRRISSEKMNVGKARMPNRYQFRLLCFFSGDGVISLTLCWFKALIKRWICMQWTPVYVYLVTLYDGLWSKTYHLWVNVGLKFDAPVTWTSAVNDDDDIANWSQRVQPEKPEAHHMKGSTILWNSSLSSDNHSMLGK